jgi:hypothetical protein
MPFPPHPHNGLEPHKMRQIHRGYGRHNIGTTNPGGGSAEQQQQERPEQVDPSTARPRARGQKAAHVIPQAYSALIGLGQKNALADTTQRKQTTSLRHWKVYTEKELGIKPVLTTRELEAYGSFTQDEIEVRTLIILGFVVKMVAGKGKYLRSHATEQTIQTYLTEVDTWHYNECKQPLIPAINRREILKSVGRVSKGLVKLNSPMHSTWKRRGLRGRQVKALF